MSELTWQPSEPLSDRLPGRGRPTSRDWEANDPEDRTIPLEAGALPERIDLCAPQLIWHPDGERLLVICPPDQNVWTLPTPYVRYTLAQLSEMFRDTDWPLLLRLRAGCSLAEVEVAALQLRAWLGAGCLEAMRESLRSPWPAAVYGWPGRLVHTSFALKLGGTAGAVAVYSYLERCSVPAPDSIHHCWITPAELPEPDETGTTRLRGRQVAANLVRLLQRRWAPPDQTADPGDHW